MTPDEMELLIKRVLNEGVRLQTLEYVILLGVLALGGVVGSFLTAYAKKRGENFATKEDFNQLMEQVRLQTKVTEEIKSEIANEKWIQERRWDFKREVYSELLAVLEEFRQRMYWFGVRDFNFLDPAAMKEGLESYRKYMFEKGVVDKFISLHGRAGMILNENALQALSQFSIRFNEMVTAVGGANTDEAVNRVSLALVEDFIDATKEAYDLVCKAANDDLLGGAANASKQERPQEQTFAKS
jgi:hypothetical protein